MYIGIYGQRPFTYPSAKKKQVCVFGTQKLRYSLRLNGKLAKAKDAGMRLSDWIRAAAKAAKVVARLKPEDLQIMRMLAGLANNLNQLTKLAHRDGILTIAIKCGNLLIEIDQALKYFNSDDRQNT
jgi:hypothetical protein